MSKIAIVILVLGLSFLVKYAIDEDWIGEAGRVGIGVLAGGVLIAIESVIDNERRQNAFGLLMSLNMLIEIGDGFDYTAAQFDGWAKEAGFQKTTLLPLTGPTSAAIAWK